MATTQSLLATSVFARRLFSTASTAPSSNGAARARTLGGSATSVTMSASTQRAAAIDAAAANANQNYQVTRVKTLVDKSYRIADTALYSASTLATVTGTTAGLSTGAHVVLTHGTTIVVSDGFRSATFTGASGLSIADLIAAINNTSEMNVKASLTDDGRLKLEATAENAITIGGTASAEDLARIGLSAGTTTSSVNMQRRAAARAYDAVRDEIDAIKLTAPETGSPVSGADSTGDGGHFQSDGEIKSALAGLSVAKQKLAAQFPSSSARATSNASLALAVAAALGIRGDEPALPQTDSDGAALLTQQLRTSLSTNALSLTSSIDGQILRQLASA